MIDQEDNFLQSHLLMFFQYEIHNIRWYWQRNVFLLWFNYGKSLLKCGMAAKEMDSFSNVTCWCFSIWNSQHQVSLAEEYLILWIRLGCDAFSACCGSKADEMVVLTTQFCVYFTCGLLPWWVNYWWLRIGYWTELWSQLIRDSVIWPG